MITRGNGQTRHGLWRIHRAIRSYNKWVDRDWEWWNDPAKIQRALTVDFFNRCRRVDNYEVVNACAYRFIRRWPSRVRTVKQYNDIVAIICRRAGFGHQTLRASTIHQRGRARITINDGWARPRFFDDEVVDRAKSIARIREEKRQHKNLKVLRSITKTKAELEIIRAAIKSAQSAINRV